MKKFLNIFFVTLGVIFFCLILLGLYFFIADPLNLKPLLFNSDATEQTEKSTSINLETSSVDKHPALSDTQEKTLETFGIDPTTLPTEITTEQEQCFKNAVGAARVEEIKNGDTPTAIEVFRGKDCL
ncbi:hypothetical protein CL655_01190 [bacterium]|nr:hypothetical protein [bacterium]|tara:strand:+ start:2616 stop:2996 length:381 start_codon:yes stop_codon:yes gene_type:complete